MTAENIARLLTDRAEASRAVLARVTDVSDIGFNAFALMSDVYHRENFHSDVLRHILDVRGTHKENDLFLHLFIDLLCKISSLKIDKALYPGTTQVVREKGRRDITIYGDRHAIIIENKINNAGDTANQIPTYVADVRRQGYIIDAIVYLTLNQTKAPDESTWQVEAKDKDFIGQKLILWRAYTNGKNDLCGWLEQCASVTADQNRFVISQYQSLLKHLTRNHMDMDLLADTDQYLQGHPEMCDVAIGLQHTLMQYPYYVLTKVYNYFKADKRYLPFKGILEYRQDVFYLSKYDIAGYSFNTDIIIYDLQNCKIDFSVRYSVEYQQRYPEKVLEIIGMLDEFEWNESGLNNLGRYEHIVQSPFVGFEKNIIDFLERFLGKLRTKETEIQMALKAFT